MDFLARKVNSAKWKPKDGMPPRAIRADAITACLKTTNDALSVWECQDDEADVAQIVLALSTTFDLVDKVAIVLVRTTDVTTGGVEVEVAAGDTYVVDLNPRHRNLVHLDSEKLAALARYVADAVRDNGLHYQFTKRQVADILRVAVRDGRVDEDLLRDGVRKAIG